MGKTSSIVKDRYNKKAYDEIKIRVAKGEKEKIQVHAQTLKKSVNAFIIEAIQEAIQRESPSNPPPKKESPLIKEKPTMVVTQKENDVDDDLTEEIPIWKKCHFPSEEAYNAQLEKARESETDYGYCFDEIIANHTKEKEIKESNLCPWEDED